MPESRLQKPTGKPSATQNPVTPTPMPGKTKSEKIDLDAAHKEVPKLEHPVRGSLRRRERPSGAAVIAFASEDIRVLREDFVSSGG